MDKGKEPIYELETYEGGSTETLNFDKNLFNKIKEDKEEITVKNIFKTRFFERNKEVRYIAQRHENPIDIKSITGKARISLITEEGIKREINKIPNKKVNRYKNLYIGAIEFTIKAYFQKNIDTPIEIYVIDDRIENLQDAIIKVIKGNLIYQKIKFVIQPDFSLSLDDKNKDFALTLYFKLGGINMLPGSKIISIETKMIYALTGNHHVKRQFEDNILIPNMYRNFVEECEIKGNSEVTIPEELEMDFNYNKKRIEPQVYKPVIDGRRLSFNCKRSLLRDVRNLDLAESSTKNHSEIKIKIIIFKGIVAYECVAKIDYRIEQNFIHIKQVKEEECKELVVPYTLDNIIIRKNISVRFTRYKEVRYIALIPISTVSVHMI